MRRIDAQCLRYAFPGSGRIAETIAAGNIYWTFRKC
jgi:hypothetical protein